MRTKTVADIRAGRAAPEQHIAKFISYLLDTSYKGNEAAVRFLKYLDHVKISPSQRTVFHLMALLTHPSEPINPFLTGMDAVKDLFQQFCDPCGGVRPCKDEEEVAMVTRWLYVDGGRRAGGHKLSEGDAIREGERFVRTSLADYSERLIGWHRLEPWTVAVSGDSLDFPVAMSVTAPISEARYELIRAGKLDMLRSTLEPGLVRSADLFFETFAQRQLPRRGWTITPQLFHMLRAVLCQQAVLSDVPGLGHTRPLRIISLGCTEEYRIWLQRFNYVPVGVAMPETQLELWGRDFWTKRLWLQYSAHLGVWHGIQRRFREPD